MEPATATLTKRDTAFNLYGWPDTFAAEFSGGRWLPYRHLQYTSERIVPAIVDGGGRVIVNMPARHGKSEFLSHWLPVWFLERWPEKRLIVCSHGAELAAEWGRKVRNTFATTPGLETELSPDSKAANRWNTTKGGGMVTGGVGSGIAGWGGHLILVDDPYPDWESAHSRLYRRKLVDWWESVLLNRQEPGCTIVLLHHRWHPQDLTAHLLGKAEEHWEHVRLPAVAETSDPLGREPGEPLCPERFNAIDLALKRIEQGDQKWPALWQQDPKVQVEQAVYHRFGQANIDPDADLTYALPLQVSFDFNRNPSMHVLIGQYDPKADMFIECYELVKSRSLAGSLEELAEWIKTHAMLRGKFAYPGLEVFGDPQGSGHNTQSGATDYSLISGALYRLGIQQRIRVARAHPPITERTGAGNDALKDIAGEVHAKFHPRCTRLIRDCQEQEIGDDNKPDKTNKELGHMGDAWTYKVHYLRPVGGPVRMPTGRIVLG